MQDAIRDFLAAGPYAVVGASNDRTKYGNRLLKAYWARGLTAYPVNPRAEQIEGKRCFPDLTSLPEPVKHVSIVTRPIEAEEIVRQAAESGAEIVWMQPGASSEEGIAEAKKLGLRVIAGGPCVLTELP